MKGLVHMYTGDGKGKTTAAIGLLIRALGHGLKCCFVSFHKNPKKYNYGEIKILKKLKVKTFHFAKNCPYFNKKVDVEEVRKEVETAMNFIKSKLFYQNYDLIVLDEILVCARENFLDLNKLVDLIKSKPENLELVLTGQANEKIVSLLKNYVGYVTFMRKLKHPYDDGIERRKGIEY